MTVKNSLAATVVHIFRDVIIPKKKSFLVIYLLLIISNFVPPIISYLLLSSIINIMLTYLYLSSEDSLPIDKIKQIIQENFFNVFKITIINLGIVAILTATALQIYSLVNGSAILPLLVIASLPVIIFIVGVVSFTVIYTIIENTKVTVAINKSIYTTKNRFALLLKLILFFVLFALGISSNIFILNFISLVMQLSFISIVVDSINFRR
jgi:hypothetical protein